MLSCLKISHKCIHPAFHKPFPGLGTEAEMVGYKEGGQFLREFCFGGRTMKTNNGTTIERMTQRHVERDSNVCRGYLYSDGRNRFILEIY